MIGNSHIGCIKRGWDRIADDVSGTDLCFFASARRTLCALEVDGTVVRAPDGSDLLARISESSGGKSAIDPHEYDAFFVIGGWKISQIDFRVSSAVLRVLTEELIGDAMCGIVAAKLRAVTDKPIFVGHDPLRALDADVVSKKKDNVVPYERIISVADGAMADSGFSIVPQPDETRSSDISTIVSFARGSLRLRGGAAHEDRDRGHMNDDYGVIYTRALLQRIATAAAPCA